MFPKPLTSCDAVAPLDSVTRTLPLPVIPLAADTMQESGCLNACGRTRVTGVLAVKVPSLLAMLLPSR
jgi:hypothetical protein